MKFKKDKYCPICFSSDLISPTIDQLLCLECGWLDNEDNALNSKDLRKEKIERIDERTKNNIG